MTKISDDNFCKNLPDYMRLWARPPILNMRLWSVPNLLNILRFMSLLTTLQIRLTLQLLNSSVGRLFIILRLWTRPEWSATMSTTRTVKALNILRIKYQTVTLNILMMLIPLTSLLTTAKFHFFTFLFSDVKFLMWSSWLTFFKKTR